MSKETSALNYQWMVRYTPQVAWISGKGLYLWLAFFFTEIFAGAYFISLFLNLEAGLMIGWLGSLGLGGFLHMLYLGKATRGWRILFKVSSSELSRGLWIIIFFGAIGFIQLIPIVFPDLPWSCNALVLKVIAGVLCILVIIHGFTTMSVIKALPMWNSPMMVPLSLASGIWIGSQIIAVVTAIAGGNMIGSEVWTRWSLFFLIGSLLVYIWGNLHASVTAKASVKRILAGDCSVYFYVGVLVIGILIPLIITLSLWGNNVTNISVGVLVLRFLCALIGDAIMRYVLMKAPFYTPLI